MTFRDRFDSWRESGREEGGLSRSGSGVEYGLEVFGETHVEHFVAFVEDDCADVAQVECLSADVIECAARCGDDDVDSAAKYDELLMN